MKVSFFSYCSQNQFNLAIMCYSMCFFCADAVFIHYTIIFVLQAVLLAAPDVPMWVYVPPAWRQLIKMEMSAKVMRIFSVNTLDSYIYVTDGSKQKVCLVE